MLVESPFFGGFPHETPRHGCIVPKDVQAESDFQKALELAENDEEQRPISTINGEKPVTSPPTNPGE